MKATWFTGSTNETEAQANLNGLTARIHLYTEGYSAGRYFWGIRLDSDWSCDQGGIVDTDEEAAAQCQHWLDAGAEAIKAAWVADQLLEIETIVQKIARVVPEAARVIPGYAQGRQAGYEAARSAIAAAFGLVPREQLDAAENARIDAESLTDFERDYALGLEDQLGELRTSAKAITPAGELAIVGCHQDQLEAA